MFITNKIRLLIIGLMTMIIFMASCSSYGKSFTATVLENNQTSLLVEPKEGSNELRSADKIVVSVRDAAILNSTNTELTIIDIESGNQVEIYYSGAIAESYPAQIHKCYKIRLLD